ncbi:hypothetical protein GF327_01165 [Candidatus Woesearchaeota archaeon]|nr:hypothetical protein [Candidatus Woesearchaeota archaeon]
MSTDLFVPNFSLNSGSTKDKLIFILSSNPGLKTKKIHHLLKKKFGVSVTYQAVHKLLKQLVEDGVVEQKGYKYRINDKWIDQLYNFVEHLKKKTNSDQPTAIEKGISFLDSNSMVQSITFNKLENLDIFYNKLREKQLKFISKIDPDERIVCYHAIHYYGALLAPQKEYNYLKILKSKNMKAYGLCKGDTLLDRWVRDFYLQNKKSNYFLKTGVDCADLSEIWLFPTLLVEIHYSANFLSIFDDLYKSVKEIRDIKINEVLNKMYKNQDPILIVLNKNKEIIDSVRRKTLEHFDFIK